MMKQLFRFSKSHGAYDKLKLQIVDQVKEIKESGSYKNERAISSSQSAEITCGDKKLLNFCSNNYLGLSNNKEVIEAAKQYMDSHGFGMSSVRFICGTQDIHQQLEDKISEFYQTESTILYSSCFDANAGFFETIFNQDDAIISDALNHASIIDGIRLAKSKKFRYSHLCMKSLEEQLKLSGEGGHRVIVTDGVFSMDGDIAPLQEIVALAREYKAITMVDESHAAGFLGESGRGSVELLKVMGEIDVVSGTLGKGLGGASGGYITGRKEIVELLRQKSRPYLFSNSLAPAIVGATLKVFDLLQNQTHLIQQLQLNTTLFRSQMSQLGFHILGHSLCPIVPLYLQDAKLAQALSQIMFQQGIYVIPFSFPVVPKNQARIRVQISAAHTEEQILKTVQAFKVAGKQLSII